MTSNIPFKICVVISTCVHLIALFPFSFLRSISKPEIRFKKIELTYFGEGPAEAAVIKDMEPITSIRHTGGNENANAVKGKASDQTKNRTPEVPAPLIAEAYQEIRIGLDEDSRSGKGGTRADTGQYLAMREEYCLKVREKIKTSLEKNCQGRIKAGEVYVKFAIDRNGALKDVILYKSSGRNPQLLEAITIKSIKEASPFPPFDEKMNETELLFRQPIQISYQP